MKFHNSYEFDSLYIETEKGSDKFQEINYYYFSNKDKSISELNKQQNYYQNIID
jgi:hypothetical protein